MAVSSSSARTNENDQDQPDSVYYLGPGSSPAYRVVNLRYETRRGSAPRKYVQAPRSLVLAVEVATYWSGDSAFGMKASAGGIFNLQMDSAGVGLNGNRHGEGSGNIRTNEMRSA